jgi:hypothetical protein
VGARVRHWLRSPSVLLPIVLLVAAVWLIRQNVARPVDPAIGPLQPPQATRVAELALASTTDVLVGGVPQPAVVASEGQVVASLPPPNATAVNAEGTPLVVDRLRGVAFAPGDPGLGRPGVPIGTSQSLRPGDEVVAAPPGRDPVVVTYLGETSILLGTSGLGQTVMELQLPNGVAVDRGPVYDRRGVLVGLISPDRQASAPPGRAYAVGAEHVEAVLRAASSAAAEPKPSGRPTPRPLPTVDESQRLDTPGDD